MEIGAAEFAVGDAAQIRGLPGSGATSRIASSSTARNSRRGDGAGLVLVARFQQPLAAAGNCRRDRREMAVGFRPAGVSAHGVAHRRLPRMQRVQRKRRGCDPPADTCCARRSVRILQGRRANQRAGHVLGDAMCARRRIRRWARQCCATLAVAAAGGRSSGVSNAAATIPTSGNSTPAASRAVPAHLPPRASARSCFAVRCNRSRTRCAAHRLARRHDAPAARDAGRTRCGGSVPRCGDPSRQVLSVKAGEAMHGAAARVRTRLRRADRASRANCAAEESRRLGASAAGPRRRRSICVAREGNRAEWIARGRAGRKPGNGRRTRGRNDRRFC